MLEKTKKFIKQNYKILLIYLVTIFLFTYRLPYYIHTGGGILNTNDKIEIKDEYKSKGNFNFAYVTSRPATIPLYLISKFNKDWDINDINKSKINDEETLKDVKFRDILDLKMSIANATTNAYKLANREVEISSVDNYIFYIDNKEKTNLKVGDIILSVENKKVRDIEDIRKYVNYKDVKDKINFKVKRDNKEIDCYAEIYKKDNKKLIGISIVPLTNYKTNPEAEIKFSKNENGPSGGLILGLTIYDKLTKEDLTKGLKIVGTGTIDQDGNIGEIGGVKYKLNGAVKNKADIFIVPNENNYEECIKLKEEKKYDIKIIGVDTLEDAINKLKNIDKIKK